MISVCVCLRSLGCAKYKSLPQQIKCALYCRKENMHNMERAKICWYLCGHFDIRESLTESGISHQNV